jgi:hypothetical protein
MLSEESKTLLQNILNQIEALSGRDEDLPALIEAMQEIEGKAVNCTHELTQLLNE